jgi:hypothetical protein
MGKEHPLYEEDLRSWETVDPDDLWIYDKLLLSTKLGYKCGPVGIPTRKEGWYIVRPCVNFDGMGLGAKIEYIVNETSHLPAGYFWCEIFKGRHLSVDYKYGRQFLCVEGIRESYPDDLTKWDKWVKTDDKLLIPDEIKPILLQYKYSNCEFIDGHLIETHLRRNPNFYWGNSEYIPVYDDKNIKIPKGYRYISDNGSNIRVGALIK